MDYESRILLDWYLLFHYGSPAEILHGVGFDPSGLPPRCLEFPVATAEAAGELPAEARVLDLGCAVGRSSLELSRVAAEVIGVDYSATFVEAAESLRRGEAFPCHRYGEMHRPEPLLVRAPEDVRAERVRFERGDAMALREDLGDFDLVHAANLLCRLPEPRRLLNRLPSLVKAGGRLVLATPATWMESYTPREQQPSGLTLDYLRNHLDGAFELLSVGEMPFLIREHQRKFQLSTSQVSVWARA